MFEKDELIEVGRKIAGVSPVAAGDEELCDAAVGLAQLWSLVSMALSHVLAELDERGVCDREHGLLTGSWLAREAGLPVGVARQHVKVGAALRSPLDAVDAAAIDGRIIAHHVRVLAEACNPRVAEQVAELQDELVDLAEHASFERWRTEVKGVIELLDEDGPHDPRADLARNRLSVSESFDSTTMLSGQLVGEVALGVTAAIETKAEELFHRFAADHDTCAELPMPSLPTLRALALAELCRAGHAVDLKSTGPPRPEVTLVVRADEPAHATAPNGVRLADGTTRTLCCDADLFPLVVNSLGVPLDMGRHVRLATTAERRAMAMRDGGCVFPGCTAPISWSEAHHLDHFRKGGRTDVARLAFLCRHHHGVADRTGWQMHATADGWFWWTSPNGRTLWSQRHGRRRAGPAPPTVADGP